MKATPFIIALLCLWRSQSFSGEPIVVGSKDFTEGYILSEIMAQILEHHGFSVSRKFGLGGTIVCFRALQHAEIDLYPEYSGTIEQVILKSKKRLTYSEIQQKMRKRRFRLLRSFGFNNTYAIAVKKETAGKQDLETITDLRKKTNLKGALSHEFLERKDGWRSLKEVYGLSDLAVTGIQHSLAYEAIKHGKADFTDVYSTDPKIERFGLAVLKDDLHFFPDYEAAPLAREGLPEKVYRILSILTLSEEEIMKLNAMAEYDKKSFHEIAGLYLKEKGFISKEYRSELKSFVTTLATRTAVHLYLTFIAVALATLVSVPLAVLLYQTKRFAQPVLVAAALLQTIPSIALLALMIPLFGIGMKPAIIALFLYSLLPILRNTYTALNTLPAATKDAAAGIGLYRYESLLFVELPLSLPVIIAGIRITSVMNVGTATLAAFIGAGGLGEPIVTGLALNDTRMVLEGAVPAALLAIVIELFLESIERRIKRRF